MDRSPRWRCGEPGCEQAAWQPVSAMGEYDDLDVAMADLDSHYRRDHPDQTDDTEEVSSDGHTLAA